MISTLRKRLQNEDEGFTLIELMVVVLIIAILIAIAIPTFLGAQDRARDRGAQSDLRNALTAAKTLATDNAGKLLDASGGTLDAADLQGAESSLVFSDTAASETDILVVDEAAGANLVLVKKSASGKFFGISVTSGGVVRYCSNTDVTAINTYATCSTNTKW